MIFKYKFHEPTLMPEIEATFVLAIVATEAIHGQSETRLLVEHAMSIPKRSCVIDAATSVGKNLNRLFVGFLTREFGPDSFSIERITQTEVHETANCDRGHNHGS